MTFVTEVEPGILDASGLRGHVNTMKVYEGLEALPTPIASSSVAIGTFDGVHLGHQTLIRQAVEDAHAHCRTAVVLTFDSHPRQLFYPESVPHRLTTSYQRNALIAALGVDALVVARFDRTLAELSPDAFMADILKGRLGTQALLEGADFCFGKGRAGDMAYLARVQATYSFTLHALKPVLVGGLPISSTRVREQLRAGEIAAAEAILGHGFWLVGRVVHARRINRASDYLMADLTLLYRQITPADGSYVVRVWLDDGREGDGVCAIGAGPDHRIQTYLFACDEDLSGREMTLRFVRRLRIGEEFNSIKRPAAVRDAA